MERLTGLISIVANCWVYHSVRVCVAVPVKLHKTKSGLLPYDYALKPLLMIHIVSHSYLLFDYQQFKIIKMNTKQQEQLKFIEIANDLNQEFYEKNGEVEDRFYYSTDGYIDTFGFGDKTLWSSEMDDRKFIEDLNDYEDFKPFIINVFNDWIATMNGYVL